MTAESRLRTELPEGFVSFCREHPLLKDLPEVLGEGDASLSVRVNTCKGAEVPAEAVRVPWNPAGFYLDSRPKFTFDPALHQGLYYVQDASSMAVAAAVSAILDGERPLTVLDACAAPGGKTTAVADVLPAGSLLLANEYDSRRASALAENIERWGNPAVMVRRGDTSRFASLDPCFDLIVADVPCSGEGMMRKEPDAVAQWSPGLLRQCAALQREIVANLWPSLRPGGYLIYSTCTFNRLENEDNVRWICDELGAENLELPLGAYTGVGASLDDDVCAARFIPGRVRGEGLFMALLRKPAGAETPDGHARKREKREKRDKGSAAPRIQKPVAETLSSWLEGEYVLEQCGDGGFKALPAALSQTMRYLESELSGIILSGVELGSLKGRDLIPSYALARSQALKKGAFPVVSVGWRQAVDYLRREPLSLDGAPKGIVLLEYEGHPLGFVKNLGNRANNLLPQSRRIISPAIPEEAPRVL